MLMMYLSIVETPEERSLFEQIYYTYRKQMFFVAISILNDEILAEDALQEAFMGIAKQITLFRNMPEQNRKAYVLTAAKNAAINIGKQEQRVNQLYTSFDDAAVVSYRDQVLDEQIYRETCQTLFAAISKLPAFQRDILMLKYANNMNCAQIALALGKKPSTVRKELSRARKALRNGCKKEGLDIED